MRIDIVWDQYWPNSIKSSTRQNRGTGVRTKVSPHTKMPKNMKNFLLVSENKTELFDYISQVVEEHNFPEGKSVFITKGQEVISKNTDHEMEICTHEEADTRIMVHILHAIQQGAKKIIVRTVDTDVLVILIGQFFYLQHLCSLIDLWIAFGVGKNYCFYSINHIALYLGERTPNALPMFHAFTGCDTTSFFRKGKKIAWQSWKSCLSVTDAFLAVRNKPFQEIRTESEEFKL